jgi:hypothetical protein
MPGTRPLTIRARAGLLILLAGVLTLGGARETSTLAAPPASAHAIALFGPGQAASAIDLGCPSTDPGDGRSFRIKVTKWCSVAGPRGQWQLKLQVRITNTGRKPLNIGVSHIALIVDQLDPDRWSPPRHTRQAATRPYRTTYQHRRVWVIPANPERAYDDLPPKGNRSFATHWNVSGRLAAHETFVPKDRARGAVVYYVPNSPHGQTLTALGVVGLAYVDGPDISVVCPWERWGKKVTAEDF